MVGEIVVEYQTIVRGGKEERDAVGERGEERRGGEEEREKEERSWGRRSYKEVVCVCIASVVDSGRVAGWCTGLGLFVCMQICM